ncbi:MAG: 16S rRNA (guanine(966)-N(2))-methyltransferase RsmD [Eubacterium sp.]|nr:16S rRNA (guanine(966)-N(2))-methyltransferase RsmD [Eubacterium sp.]
MRVIAGSARRITLVTPKGNDTRPTTDRIKETLFNILQNDIRDCEFLDLFAGSGGIGIEALSRGAKSASFVEASREAVKCILTNLERAHFSEEAHVYSVDYVRAFSKLAADGRKFDIVFADPPYAAGYEEEILAGLKNYGLISEGSLVIIETSADRETDFVGDDFEIERIKDYKTNRHIFIKMK